MSNDDLPVPFRVEVQCEKKTRLRAARSASNPDGISVEDRGVGVGPVTDLQDVTEWLDAARVTAFPQVLLGQLRQLRALPYLGYGRTQRHPFFAAHVIKPDRFLARVLCPRRTVIARKPL